MNLYFECRMGAAGDMIAAALLELFEDKQAVLAQLNALGLPDTVIKAEPKVQGGIGGTHLLVECKGETEHPGEHRAHHAPHRTLAQICGIIDSLSAAEAVKAHSKAIYQLLAAAEAKAHRTAVSEIHFHELGMLDAIADIVICSYLLETLSPQKVYCSAVNAGGGSVKCAHGILPVPAPATANLLTDMPYYISDVQTELCTPTGAAILKYFVNEFTNTPHFAAVKKVGIGAGTKVLEQANILRVFAFEESTVAELSCNIDDMTGEEAGFAAEQMMAAGALDCFITPALMKKGRPAYLLSVICKAEEAPEFARLIFKHTTTIGIRKYLPARYTMQRTLMQESGVHIKRSQGYGESKEKIEFEDIKKRALEKDIFKFYFLKRAKN